MSELIEVIVGRIGRAHGVRGELSVEPRTDEPDRRFAVGATVTEEGGRRRWKITSKRWHQGRLLICLAEVGDRNAAEALRGVLLAAEVDRSERPAEAEEYYDRELIGLRVLDHNGVDAGRVTGVVHQAQDLLEVRTNAGADRLIPFVAALVPEVTPEEGTLRLADVEGLLVDLEAPHADGDQVDGQ